MTNEELWFALDQIARSPRPQKGVQFVDPHAKDIAPLLRQAEKEDLALPCAIIPSERSDDPDAPPPLAYAGPEHDKYYLCYTGEKLGKRLVRALITDTGSGKGFFQLSFVPFRELEKQFHTPETGGIYFNYLDRTWINFPKSVLHPRRKPPYPVHTVGPEQARETILEIFRRNGLLKEP